MVGRDGGVGGFFEIRSMEVHCRAEGRSRIMDRQVLRVWRGAARERRGLFCRRFACLRSTRSVRSTDRKFVAEAGYPCGRIANNKGNKGTKAQMNDAMQ